MALVDPTADRTITFPDATGTIPLLENADTITGNWVNTANPWADNEVDDALTVSGGTINNSVIGGVTPAAGTFTDLIANGSTTIGDGGDTVAINSSDWDISTTGAITGVSLDANGTGNSVSNIDNADLTADTLDFDRFADSMTLDATQTINLGNNLFTFDMSGGTGDVVMYNGVTTAAFRDDGSIDLVGSPINLGNSSTVDIVVNTATPADGVFSDSAEFILRARNNPTGAGPVADQDVIILNDVTDENGTNSLTFNIDGSVQLSLSDTGLLTANEDLSIGAGNAGDDDSLFFDAGSESLVWDDAPGEFDLSDDLNVGGNVTVGSSTETILDAGFALSGDDIFVADDLGIEDNIYSDGNIVFSTNSPYVAGALGVISQVDEISFLDVNTPGFSVQFRANGDDNILNYRWDDTTAGGINFFSDSDGSPDMQGSIRGSGSTGTPEFGIADTSSQFALSIVDDDFIRFQVNGDEKMRIEDTGNLIEFDADNAGAGANVRLLANQGSDLDGEIRYNATSNQWEISNDGGGFAAIQTGAGSGGWTDDGTVVRLTTTTDDVTVGSTLNLAKLAVDGESDEVQLLVQADAGQAVNDLFVVEESNGTDLFTIDSDAVITHSPALDSGAPSTTVGHWFSQSAQTFTDSSTAPSGTAAAHLFNSYAPATLAASNTVVTTTDAATVYIQGAPAAGANMTITNPYALWVDAGSSRFDGSLVVGTNTTYADGSLTRATGGAFNLVLGGAAGDDFTVDTNVLVVESDNNKVGINTSSPREELDVRATVPVITIYDTDSATATAQQGWIEFMRAGDSLAGYVGFGSGSSSTLTLENNAGDVELDAGAGNKIDMQNPVKRSLQAGVTAGPGGGTSITEDFVDVTTVTVANYDVTLPTDPTGRQMFIMNHGANVLDVVPGTGDQINSGGADVPKTVAVNATLMCIGLDASNWECVTFAR